MFFFLIMWVIFCSYCYKKWQNFLQCIENFKHVCIGTQVGVFYGSYGKRLYSLLSGQVMRLIFFISFVIVCWKLFPVILSSCLTTLFFLFVSDKIHTFLLLCIWTSKRMLAHAFAWSKTIWVRKYLFHHAYERLTN